MKQESTLFLDQDGFLADFDEAFPRVFGVSHIGMPKPEMWNYIRQDPDFFFNLPPMPGALHFFNRIAATNPTILTACPIDEGFDLYAHVADQKRRWIRKYLGPSIRMIPAPGSESKPLFMHAPGDILIDDWGKNVEAWRKAGGRAIHHQEFNVTHAELVRMNREVGYAAV